MRLFLVVAVLLVALVAYAEAQDETFEQKFTKFGEQVAEMGKNWAAKAKTAFDEVKTSDTMTSISGWWSEQMEKVKKSLS